jgi:hypothetical protein
MQSQRMNIVTSLFMQLEMRYGWSKFVAESEGDTCCFGTEL